MNNPLLQELKLCNCDGFWHVSVPDNDGLSTAQPIDVSLLLDTLVKRLPNKENGPYAYHEDLTYQDSHWRRFGYNQALEEVTKIIKDLRKEL